MDSVKTLFSGQAKDAALSNDQRSGFSLFAGRTMQGGNGLGNGGTSGNGSGSTMTSSHNKRKDSDSYFYIMWRS